MGTGDSASQSYTQVPLPDRCDPTHHPPSHEQSPHTCHSEPGAGCKVEGRIIGTQLQVALVKPTSCPKSESGFQFPGSWMAATLPTGRILDYSNSVRHTTGEGQEKGTQKGLRANKKVR